MTDEHFQGAPDQSLWDFATGVYSRCEVEQLSLDLQDKYDANINILLWATWLEVTGITLSKEVLEDVMAVEVVSSVSVDRLRSVRQDIKEVGRFTKVQAQMINKLILNAELAIEKVLVHRLQDMTLKFKEVMQDKANPISLVDYLNHLNVESADKKARAFIRACNTRSVAL